MGLPMVWFLLYKARLRNLAPSYLSLDLSKKCPFISDLFHSFVTAHLTSIITEEKKKFIGMPVFCMLVFVLYCTVNWNYARKSVWLETRFVIVKFLQGKILR